VKTVLPADYADFTELNLPAASSEVSWGRISDRRKRRGIQPQAIKLLGLYRAHFKTLICYSLKLAGFEMRLQ
jgi:hypothetical protein